MGPNTKIFTKRDSALIWTLFDSSREQKQFQTKKVKNRMNRKNLAEMSSKFFGGLNQKSGSISLSGI